MYKRFIKIPKGYIGELTYPFMYLDTNDTVQLIWYDTSDNTYLVRLPKHLHGQGIKGRFLKSPYKRYNYLWVPKDLLEIDKVS